MATQDIDSRLCPACQRKILAPQHRRCMYCGLTLPKNLVMSDADATHLRREKHEKWRLETAANEARSAKNKDTKRNKRKKAEPEESESAILLNAIAQHHATKKEDAGTDVVKKASEKSAAFNEPVRKVTANSAPQTEEEVLAAAKLQATKIAAAKLEVARLKAKLKRDTKGTRP